MNKVKRGLGTHPKGDDIAVVMAIFVVERRRLVLDGDILTASRDECCGWCMVGVWLVYGWCMVGVWLLNGLDTALSIGRPVSELIRVKTSASGRFLARC
jgi:hypothetical protein